MKTKFKCWKKDAQHLDIWSKKGNSISLNVIPFSKDYGVLVGKRNKLIIKPKSFKTKSRALSFAYKYMKKHDVC